MKKGIVVNTNGDTALAKCLITIALKNGYETEGGQDYEKRKYLSFEFKGKIHFYLSDETDPRSVKEMAEDNDWLYFEITDLKNILFFLSVPIVKFGNLHCMFLPNGAVRIKDLLIPNEIMEQIILFRSEVIKNPTF